MAEMFFVHEFLHNPFSIFRCWDPEPVLTEIIPCGCGSGARISFLSMFMTCRSVKDTLESSLFEAQQHSSHLEITKSQLEIQLHTIIQAKEVIQGESLMYFISGVHLQCNAEG